MNNEQKMEELKTRSTQVESENEQLKETQSEKLEKSTKKLEKKSINPPKKEPEVEEMPPTANSQKSEEKKTAKKTKKLGGKSTEEKAQKTTETVRKTEKTAEKIDKSIKNTPIVEPIVDLPTEKEEKPAKDSEKIGEKKKINHVCHMRPGVNKNVEKLRRILFCEELVQFETGEFTYLTDTTRYRFHSSPPLELVIRVVFPSILLLAIILSSIYCWDFITSEYKPDMVFDELSEMTLAKYDTFMVVKSIDQYLRNETVLKDFNCPGLLQGPFLPLQDHELKLLNFGKHIVKAGKKAISYRWIYQVDAVLNMIFDCPPSVLIELE